MTQENIPSKRFEVWRRLYSRFLLEPFPAGRVGPDVSKTIIPVTQADELFKSPVMQTVDMPNFNGEGTSFTVPLDERWALMAYDIRRLTGNRDLFRVIVSDNGTNFFLENNLVTTESQVVLGTTLVLEKGWRFGIQVAGGTTDGQYRVNLLTVVGDTF